MTLPIDNVGILRPLRAVGEGDGDEQIGDGNGSGTGDGSGSGNGATCQPRGTFIQCRTQSNGIVVGIFSDGVQSDGTCGTYEQVDSRCATSYRVCNSTDRVEGPPSGYQQSTDATGPCVIFVPPTGRVNVSISVNDSLPITPNVTIQRISGGDPISITVLGNTPLTLPIGEYRITADNVSANNREYAPLPTTLTINVSENLDNSVRISYTRINPVETTTTTTLGPAQTTTQYPNVYLEPSSISFGYEQQSNIYPTAKFFDVVNPSNRAHAISIASDSRFEVRPPSFTITANSRLTVEVRLNTQNIQTFPLGLTNVLLTITVTPS